MNKIHSQTLNDIIKNKTLGSSQLVNKLNQYFLFNIDRKSNFTSDIKLVKKELGHFEIVNTYLKELELKIKKESKLQLVYFLRNYIEQELKRIEIIFKKIYPIIKNKNTVITLSRSGTVLEVLKLWKQKNNSLKVIVCESRPKLEGRLMAKELAKIGIKTVLITDAMMGMLITKIDTAIIGADIILNNGDVVNKAGSLPLALICKEYNKPLYVVSTKSKKSKKKVYNTKKENPEEILSKKIKNLSASNIYFEVIDKKFIVKVITE